ncbi:MAG TPA: hypothetical protein VNE42_08510, partial [Acidimicrobiales bacterium]|nr:hypothetical protein [Acidimicrobiales bacterium]
FNNYAIVQGVDEIVPVDVYAPGCPPSPQTLIHAILTLHEQVRTGEIMNRRESRTGAIEIGNEANVTGWTQSLPNPTRVGTPK